MSACARTEVIRALEALAPLELAGEWDNVGLLIEPSQDRPVSCVLLTIDLTAAVLEEARSVGAQFVVSYHPPIFAPLRRLTQASDRERVALQAVEAGLVLYSPHTALDAARGGVNDWLASAFASSQVEAIEPHGEDPGVGQGRRLCLSPALELDQCVARIKDHLQLRHVQVATATAQREGGRISRVALCAGAGGSVLEGQAADLYWTGEMRHHDVLAAVARGTSVVLCQHTNTERGYLRVLAETLRQRLSCEIVVSQEDADPLRVS